MESMQSSLPPTVTPGWNDPPNLGGVQSSTATNRLNRLHRRPVDPSISSITPGTGMQPHHFHGGYEPGHHVHSQIPTEQYGFDPTPVSVGMATSPPVVGMGITHATMPTLPPSSYNHQQSVQQTTNMQYQTTSTLLQSNIAPFPNEHSQQQPFNGHVQQTHGSNNGQVFFQHQSHGVPPIQRL
ncbi:unnamed protein product [Cylicocyclus nassatus]|uniref:Uncharacterized protein n=1 Tax=Cylicocyclus nassatus TaxID=53992 RepID=A0AA36GYL0_CYLNA|nr:unnamed protein product [Cylicocyclus nassatus]